MKVLALVPAYNEVKRIGQTLLGLKEVKEVSKIFLVDDGSTDGTSKIAQELGIEVFKLNKNIGKGGALNYALTQLKEFDYEIILLIDGDVGETSKEARKILEPVLKKEADLSIGILPKAKKKGGFGLVKSLATWGIKKIGDFESKAPLSGQRAMTRQLIERIGQFERGFGLEVGLTIDALKNGFKVVEVPVEMSHQETGRNIRDFIHRGRQLLSVFKVILSRMR